MKPLYEAISRKDKTMLTTKEANAVLARGARSRAHPVKLTALLYLREALNEERYEEMAELVEIAKDFGTDYWELRKVLTPSGE